MFELHITCSKDIDKLSIDFSDGTSVISSKSDKPEKNISNIEKTKEPKKSKERISLPVYLETETEFEVNNEVIQKPVIADLDRPAKVTNEIQNADF